jgi:iron(III) transport system ATP-binding protein
LFPHLSVERNIGFGLDRHGPERNTRIAELMDLVALDRSMLKRWPHDLSGGQQQRVALARAMAQRPRLMLLDEPFSALDTGLRAATRKAVASLLAESGITTILVTHDQAEALSFADKVGIMRGGRLVQIGSPAEVYSRPRDATTAEFLGEAIILPATLCDGWADCILGRIAVDDAMRQGAAHIMLRPEQLQISIDEANGSGCLGTVTDIDFGGSSSGLTIQLQGVHTVNHTLLIRCANTQMPMVGATVKMAPTGLAHVLDQRI